MSRSTTTSKAALARLKPEVALYVGGMGHRDKNFHKDIMIRRGFKDAADRIQELYLAHRKDEAIAAVPDEWVDLKSLVGPPARIKQRFRAWEDSGATGLTIRWQGRASHRGDGRGRAAQPGVTLSSRRMCTQPSRRAPRPSSPALW